MDVLVAQKPVYSRPTQSTYIRLGCFACTPFSASHSLVSVAIMFIILLFSQSAFCEVLQPHVVYILADDLGWNEVSWNNPGFLTPNLERLASNGVLLNQSYVSPKCSPSRAALLSGLYPWRLGMQRGAIGKNSHTQSKLFSCFYLIFNRKVPPNGPRSQNTFAPSNITRRGLCNTYGKRRPKQAFLFLHQVGKWHLGFCNSSYLPTNRGFQSFFGQLSQVLLLGEMKTILIIQVTDYYTRKFSYTDFHLTAEAQVRFRSNHPDR